MSEKLIEVKNLLDNVSGTMCSAKWQQVTLHLHNGHTHSCHHPQVHEIPLDELAEDVSALHNTKAKKLARKQMLEGARPQECQYCWNVEDLNGFSENKIFSDRIIKSADSWASNDPGELSKFPWDANILPTYVEVSFSNHCNLKCSYCSPIYSSRWVEESQRYGPYQTSMQFGGLEYIRQSNAMPIHHKQHNPYVEAFWEWWPELIKSLKVFRITGGEPLLSKDTDRVLDYLYLNPKPDLELAINTNGSVPTAIFDKFVGKCQKLLEHNKIKSLHVYTSVDGWKDTAEYSRFGLDFELWQRNVEYFLSEVPLGRVVVMCTTNIFSVGDFRSLLEYLIKVRKRYFSSVRDQPITIDTAILRFPHHQNLIILDEKNKSCLDESLAYMRSNLNDGSNNSGFLPHELEKLERLITFMKEGSTSEDGINISEARMDFYSFVVEHDRRRKTNFLGTFPKLSSFFEECKNLYDKNRKDHSVNDVAVERVY